MDNQDNPFMNLVSIINKKEKNNTFFIGKVISSIPLKIQVGGIQFDRDDFLINTAYLNNNIPDYTQSTFNVGEKLLVLISDDQQQFVLVCKVR